MADYYPYNIDYSLYFVEKYGHGRHEQNSLSDAEKVTCRDDDGWFYVYECYTQDMATDIMELFRIISGEED